MSEHNEHNQVQQRAKSKFSLNASSFRGLFQPESRGALALGFIIFVIAVAGVSVFWAYTTKEPSVSVQAGGISTPDVKADAKSEMTDSYKEAKRLDNNERYEQAITCLLYTSDAADE